MARHYSPRSFSRHAPNAMLKQYFDKQGVLTEHDFSAVSKTKSSQSTKRDYPCPMPSAEK